MKKGELEADTDELICEYRAQLAIQLDAERALKLSKRRNFSSDKSRKGSIVNLTLTQYLNLLCEDLIISCCSPMMSQITKTEILRRKEAKRKRCLLSLKTDGAMSFIASININHVEFAALFFLRVVI